MQWLRAAAAGCRLIESTIVAAARSGDLGRWLRDQGCSMRRCVGVLWSALLHADLAVARWLVDQAGCQLPDAGSTGWEPPLRGVAWGRVDGVAKLQWLQERGAPPMRAADNGIGGGAGDCSAANRPGRVGALPVVRLWGGRIAASQPRHRAASSSSSHVW